MNSTVSVVLNVYKRSSIFREQLYAIKKQTVKPIEILVWENGTESVPTDLRKDLIIARANHNFGVWARFSFALNAVGDFICIIDDDTIPGSKWLENCIETMKITPGLLGTRGLIFDSKFSYSMNHDVGIYKPNEETTQVDIVGHSWFFKKEWLNIFWGYGDKKFKDNLVGEDIHFSFALQNSLNIPTLVPKHPISDPSLWGADPKLSTIYGTGEESISTSNKSLKKFENALAHYRKLGFKSLTELDSTIQTKHRKCIYKLVRLFPRLMHRIAKMQNSIQ